jgi:periplasmic protein TonB
MNSTGLKYKSFFYSFSIHMFFALIVLFIYIKQDKEHETYSLVNLNSMTICSPAVQSAPDSSTLKVRHTKTPPPEVAAEKKTVVKKVKKTVQAKKSVVKKAETAPLKTVAMVEEKVVPQPIEEETVQEEEPLAVSEQESTPPVMAEDSLEEQSAQTVVSAEPEPSYEAQYMEDHIALINALIKKNLSYPRLAQKRGLQGKTMVSFTLGMDGKISDIEALGIIASILKKSAIKTVQKASSSFPHPKETLALRIPIVYKLYQH